MEENIKQNNIILEAREFASNEIRPFAEIGRAHV